MTPLEKLAGEIDRFKNSLQSTREIGVNQYPELFGFMDEFRTLWSPKDAADAVNLEGCKFPGGLSLENRELPPLILRNCEFGGGISISRATFLGRLDLSGSNIYKAGRFSECRFTGQFYADNIRVYPPLDFSDSVWHGNSYIRGGTFHQEALFPRCRFERLSYFNSSDFRSLADFSFCYFFNVWFNNAKFRGTTAFSGARFSPWAPQFHETELHRDTSFAGATFEAYEHEQDWRAYRTLKEHMARVKAQEEESFFFAHEQRARRKFRPSYVPVWSDTFSTGGLKNLLNRARKSLTTVHLNTIVAPSAVNDVVSFLYDFGSNYGQNIARPFLWWLAQLVGFGYLYLWHVDRLTASSKWLSGELHELLVAVMFSLQSSLNPLALFSKEPLISVSSFSIFLAGMLQAIVSVSLLTLGLLAIRRRFHKGSE